MKKKIIKAKSCSVYALRIFDKEYFDGKKATQEDNIYHGTLKNEKTKKTRFFHTPGELLLLIEKMQKEKNEEKK